MNISPATLYANFKTQNLNTWASSSFDFVRDYQTAKNSPLLPTQTNNESTNSIFTLFDSSKITDTLSLGRNLTLPNPESAYKMMSVINNKDVTYKAQFSELSQLQSYVKKLQVEGQFLTSIDLSTDKDQIKAQLNRFVTQYNDWIQRFEPDVQEGGLLADTQAAQVAVYELDQSIKNIFNGAKDGIKGLNEIGVSIDPATHLASLDTAQLDLVLETNKQGAISAIEEFGANFTKSAGLLNAENNFIPNQLDNLNRAIHYIAENKVALQAEFGLGNPAKPTDQVSKALAAYNETYKL